MVKTSVLNFRPALLKSWTARIIASLARIRRSSSYRLRPVWASYACRWSIKYATSSPVAGCWFGLFFTPEIRPKLTVVWRPTFIHAWISWLRHPLAINAFTIRFSRSVSPFFGFAAIALPPQFHLFNRLPRRAQEMQAPPLSARRRSTDLSRGEAFRVVRDNVKIATKFGWDDEVRLEHRPGHRRAQSRHQQQVGETFAHEHNVGVLKSRKRRVGGGSADYQGRNPYPDRRAAGAGRSAIMVMYTIAALRCGRPESTLKGQCGSQRVAPHRPPPAPHRLGTVARDGEAVLKGVKAHSLPISSQELRSRGRRESLAFSLITSVIYPERIPHRYCWGSLPLPARATQRRLSVVKRAKAQRRECARSGCSGWP